MIELKTTLNSAPATAVDLHNLSAEQTAMEVRDLNLFYGSKQALYGVNMKIPRNQVTAFIGPSGCGKSTLLRCFNRMNDLVDGCRIEGEINMDGRNIYRKGEDVADLRRRVGMVFQKANPFPKSIYENVAYGLRIQGINQKRILDEAVEQSLRGAALWDEVKDRLEESGTALSGFLAHPGQQAGERVAIRCVEAAEQLLFDGPLAVLTEHERHQVAFQLATLPLTDAQGALDETIGELGFSNAEVRDFIEMHGDLPDIWDLAHGTWEACSGTSRFKPEGAQEDLIAGIKALTPKPVVGVGRFTSADAMVRQINAGILDFIGAARPSIADPFLPKKIEEGRIDDIRECIGCNLCISSWHDGVPVRCTQNPTAGEEWRRGWHPEKIATYPKRESVLVVGAGPAGLETALSLGRRGLDVNTVVALRDQGFEFAADNISYPYLWWSRSKDFGLLERWGLMKAKPVGQRNETLVNVVARKPLEATI